MPIIKLWAVVTKHIPRCCVAMGVPARVKKEHGRDIQKPCLDVLKRGFCWDLLN